MLRRLLVALVLLLVCPSLANAATPDEYFDALTETVQAAGEAVAVLAPELSLYNHAPLAAAARRLEAINSVTLPDGSTIDVDNSLVLRRLQSGRVEGEQALESLRQLLHAFTTARAREQWVSAAEARTTLDAVLARPELKGATGKNIAQVIQELRDRLFRWLESQFTWLDIPDLPAVNLSRPIDLGLWLGGTVLAIFAAVFLGYVWYNSRHSLARSAALPGLGHLRADDARSARSAANAAAEAGEYRLAVHFLLLWAMFHLAEHAHLRFDRALTNREQVRSLSGDSETIELLRPLVDAFDAIWYGHAPCTANDYGRLRAIVERIVEAAA